MGIIRPKIQLLDNNHKINIFEEAISILENLGIYIENKEVIEIFNDNGLNHEGMRYFLPSDVIKNCLANVPNEIRLFDRERKQYLQLSDDNVHFNPGSAAMFVIDDDTGQKRHGTSQDFIRFSRIMEHLKYIEAQSTAIISQDIPLKAQDWHRLFICLSNCYKPIITGTFRKESFAIMKELLLACRLSEKDLENKPLAIFDAAPSPPLKWSDLTSQSIIDGAKSMIPVEFVSMPIGGANAPITLIGSITQHCAESLAGVVISQLTKRGTPIIWGGSPSVMDMKHGTTPMSAIESMMISIGDVEMGKFLKLPTHAYMSVSDSMIPDTQAGFEAAIGIFLGALVGINVISGPGMLESENTQSVEKLVIDNEIVGMVKRFISGIEDYGEPFASNILKDYEKKEQLLSHPTTRSLFKKELFFPSSIINRMAHNIWKSSGAKSTNKRALELASELEKKTPIKPIEKNLLNELVKIADHYIDQ
jgi:trimethylamine--corrinoid protein Co-methyltransferase